MSRPRFLADHDLNEHIIDGVQRREPALEFVRAREVGMSDRPDAELLAYAAQQDLIVALQRNCCADCCANRSPHPLARWSNL